MFPGEAERLHNYLTFDDTTFLISSHFSSHIFKNKSHETKVSDEGKFVFLNFR